MSSVVFVETPTFTRLVMEALTDDEYGAFQYWLAARPDTGDLIKGGGGIRKVRWRMDGRGKSGGLRVIYFWRRSESQILLLFLYPKNAQSSLTPAQAKLLAKVVAESFK